jgi:hypothetical protein
MGALGATGSLSGEVSAMTFVTVAYPGKHNDPGPRGTGTFGPVPATLEPGNT